MEFDIDIALKMEEIFALEWNQKYDEKISHFSIAVEQEISIASLDKLKLI